MNTPMRGMSGLKRPSQKSNIYDGNIDEEAVNSYVLNCGAMSDDDMESDEGQDETMSSQEMNESKKQRGRKRKISHSTPVPAKVTKRFDVGQLVFAKIRGYSSWPARVEEVIEDSSKGNKAETCKYRVFFYGTHDNGFCRAADMFPSTEETRTEMKKLYRRISLLKAIQEMEELPDKGFEPPEEKKSIRVKQEAKQTNVTNEAAVKKVKPLPRNKFTSREYFFGNCYEDAFPHREELEKTDLKRIFYPREPREEGAEEHDIEDISEEEFGKTLKRVEQAVEGMKSWPAALREKVDCSMPRDPRKLIVEFVEKCLELDR
ncbi:hepatoma-derived growth factor-like isoform X2 [Cloeon dipterum]|uniref:hepatoma-derived growth factor-like isoform X2 n=1 Tax=Cloeon dipterum TaxID=197152 RepID=UPI00322072AF